MFTDKELQVILDAVHELNNLDRYSILHFGSDHPYCVCCSGKCTTEEYHANKGFPHTPECKWYHLEIIKKKITETLPSNSKNSKNHNARPYGIT